jgi:hypothetical protein
MACIMLAGCIAELRVLDDLGVARGIPPTVEEQHTARFARSDSLAAVEAVARRHWHAQKNLKTDATHYGMRFACPVTADTCLDPSMHPLDGCHT